MLTSMKRLNLHDKHLLPDIKKKGRQQTALLIYFEKIIS